MLLTFTLFVTFLSLLFLIVTAATSPYTPTDYILLNCGSSTTTTSRDGRKWDGDTTSEFSPTNINQTSFASASSEQKWEVPQVPYMTARIINRPFTYSFRVSPGPKFVRLYFYPSSYSKLKMSSSSFSVTANQYTLLSSFSAFLTVESTEPQVFTIIKEYVVNILINERLNVTISPDWNSLESSYAFINGIEIVSMPDTLYKKPGEGNMVKFVGPSGFISKFKINNNTAMEKLYRLNVGGKDISPPADIGTYRTWRNDGNYLYRAASGITTNTDIPINYTNATPAYVAPKIVYTSARTMRVDGLNTSYNLTWIFPVDSGFFYLVRLHFCEFLNEVTNEGERMFFIYLNNQTAESEADVMHWSGGRGIPVYKDYVVNVFDLDGLGRSKQNLWLAMHPIKASYYGAILNGVEIFKLNQSNAALAGSYPYPTVDPSSTNNPGQSSKSKHSFLVIGITSGVIACVVAIFLIVDILVFRRLRMGKAVCGGGSKGKMHSLLPSDLCRHFSISEIRSATSDFDQNFVIGSGGFGNVYKAYIDDGSTCLAIKRSNPLSKQGVHEFETEIRMLSKLRHVNLVSLIGYSDENGEMILVYDYMANGTLCDHLYKTKNPPLTWKKRLEICIGAARGLHYLHTGLNDTIIHRDVKSTNILLDGKWVAKVSDFGISKMGPTTVSQTHVSTLVKGSFGYIDPEYFMKQQLTQKSDVYSFGVVLLEVLSARPAVVQGLPFEQVSLAEWGKSCYRDGTVDQMVDMNLSCEIVPECLKKFVEIACSCLRDKGIERPTMRDVVQNLEFALRLQVTSQRVEGDPSICLDQVQMIYPFAFTTTDNDENLMNKTGIETVFSEIDNPKAR